MTPYRTSVIASDFHPDTQAFFRGRRVLALGGAGFIGSHVVEQLLALGAKPVVLSRQARPNFLTHLDREVELVEGDITDADSLARAIKGASVVLHMAARVAGIEWNATHPASMFTENLALFTPALEAAAHSKVDRFLVTSSACVYPRHCSIPTPEEEGFKDSPEPTNAGYGWSKRMEEFLGAATAREYGLSVAIARPYNAYGPRDNFHPATSHVLAALIRKACLAEGDTFDVWGDGTHSRSFLYVDDFARGILEVAARYPQADAVNIGADEETTIANAANLIAKHVGAVRGRKLLPKFDPSQITGQPRRRCDVSKAIALLGYRAKVSLDEGLKNTIHWFLENADRPGHSHA
ncbi:MAG TPA: NAD-dependent epimerase/dehydratase family protein [Hyphomonadaceae bacterium]|nr:NAD-dependent epimerase/dehydratase family protein [Hyphomonadaceae bacterium]